ncbi:MAG: hypothetical protein PHV28_09655 [Kiritimatiellae bacterium]|nr:hypothetical protein [Kiritimatiellia bacterium]
MDKVTRGTADSPVAEEALSRTELQIEQEKLKLERERILLERERLESVRDRVKAEQGLRTDQNGKLSVTLSTLALVSIICLLAGGILGAFSTSTHLDRRNTARLQEVMQTLATASPEAVGVVTNTSGEVTKEMPAWLKAMKPKGAHAGISLVVIQ